MYENLLFLLLSTMAIIDLLMFSNYIDNDVSLDGFIFKLVIKDFTNSRVESIL